MRSKKRYLLLRAETEGSSLSAGEVLNSISSALNQLSGFIGSARAELRVWPHKQRFGEFIVRCRLDSLPLVLLASSIIKEVSGKRVAFDVLLISGSVSKLKR